MGAADFPEIAISRAWHEGRFPTRLRSTAGDEIEIIHRGAWSHGLGPDFADAMIVVNGRDFQYGAIEIHRSPRDWLAHGHHADPRYNTVILHLVLVAEDALVRRQDGVRPLLAVLDPACIPNQPVDNIQWARFGGDVCADGIERENPDRLRAILHQLGDIRFANRVARIESRLPDTEPAQLLWLELLDGLGFSANREPMRALGELAPIPRLEYALHLAPAADRRIHALALLLGCGGFLPLAPADAAAADLASPDIAAIEAVWSRLLGSGPFAPLPPTAWSRARVRPGNHPAARVTTAATIAANAVLQGGLLGALLDSIRSGDRVERRLVELADYNGEGALGLDRALNIVASGILPFAMALASWTGDDQLVDQASAAWEQLPTPEPNQVTRRARKQITRGRFPTGIGARGEQGLLHLDATQCGPRRCYECPVAAFEMTRIAAAETASNGIGTDGAIQPER